MTTQRSGRPSRWGQPHATHKDLGSTASKAPKEPQVQVRPQANEASTLSPSSRSSSYSPPPVKNPVVPRVLAHPCAKSTEHENLDRRDPRQNHSKLPEDTGSRESTPVAPWNEHKTGSHATPYVIDSGPEDSDSDDELPLGSSEKPDPCDNYGCDGLQ